MDTELLSELLTHRATEEAADRCSYRADRCDGRLPELLILLLYLEDSEEIHEHRVEDAQRVAEVDCTYSYGQNEADQEALIDARGGKRSLLREAHRLREQLVATAGYLLGYLMLHILL